jgi:hypothetical protein
MKGKAKWDAWTGNKGACGRARRWLRRRWRRGLSRRALVPRLTRLAHRPTARAGMAKEAAMNKYIETVSALKAKYA